MKSNTLKLFLIIILQSFLFFVGCQKKDDNPTGPGDGNTQTGAGTMSCKLDGAQWSATQIPGAPIPGAYANLETHSNYSTLTIIGTEINSSSVASGISLTLTTKGNFTTGEYQLDNKNYNTYTALAIFTRSGIQYGTTGETEFSGKLTITKYDTANKIVSGTFYFTAKKLSSTSNEKVLITEGKFDVKWGWF
jgi:hypothetical protein